MVRCSPLPYTGHGVVSGLRSAIAGVFKRAFLTTARRSAARWSEVGLYTQYPPFNLTKRLCAAPGSQVSSS